MTKTCPMHQYQTELSIFISSFGLWMSTQPPFKNQCVSYNSLLIRKDNIGALLCQRSYASS